MKSEVIDDELPPSIGGVGERVRVLTWNINGLRKVAASHGGLKALLDQFHADIREFQETYSSAHSQMTT